MNSLKYSFPLKSPQAPSIRIRDRGQVVLRNTKFRMNNKIFADGGKILIGKNCFFNNDCSITSKECVAIGNNTILGENVKIYDHNHSYDKSYFVSFTKFESGSVNIGNNCWIGSNVVILKGVSIVDNVIIGSGSIVIKSINVSGVYVNKSNHVLKIK